MDAEGIRAMDAEGIRAWLNDLDDMINSSGAHEGHTLNQVGRCVYCSCGKRFQGRI